METKPILTPDRSVEQPDARPQPTLPDGWRSELAPLLALFERLPPVDQQEMLAIAHQKLHLRQLSAAAADASGEGAVHDD